MRQAIRISSIAGDFDDWVDDDATVSSKHWCGTRSFDGSEDMQWASAATARLKPGSIRRAGDVGMRAVRGSIRPVIYLVFCARDSTARWRKPEPRDPSPQSGRLARPIRRRAGTNATVFAGHQRQPGGQVVVNESASLARIRASVHT
jgi:hypothetical protein